MAGVVGWIVQVFVDVGHDQIPDVVQPHSERVYRWREHYHIQHTGACCLRARARIGVDLIPARGHMAIVRHGGAGQRLPVP